MNSDEKVIDEIRQLIELLENGQLSGTDRAQMERLVGGNALARAYYVQAMALSSELRSIGALLSGARINDLESAISQSQDPIHKIRAEVWPILVANRVGIATRKTARFLVTPSPLSAIVAFVVLVGTIFVMSRVYLGDNEKLVADPAEDPSPNPVLVAWVTADQNCVWAAGAPEKRRGDPLYAGDVLDLTQGLSEVTFASGARVLLQGPGRFRVDEENSGTLMIGSLSANVPKRARGFAINTQAADIIDLGTAFGLRVSKDRATTLQVFEGTVEVRAKRSDKSEERKRFVLRAGEALHVDPHGVSRPDAPKTEFVRQMPSSRDRLHKERVAFWLFDNKSLTDTSGSLPPNTGSHSGTPRFSPDTPFGKGQSLLFDGRGDWFNVGNRVNGLYRDGMANELTIAAWIKPDLAGFVGNRRGFIAKKWREGAREIWLDVQKDGVLAFMISEDAKGKKIAAVNTDPVVAANRWSHIAAVFRGGEFLRVYCNGRLVGEDSTGVPEHFRALDVVLRIGQDSEASYAKCFKGVMDDVMIYRRALSGKEVRLLYGK